MGADADMTAFADFHGLSALSALTAELLGDADVIVQFMAPAGLTDIEYGAWPRVWARRGPGDWLPLDLTGQARQLAGLLALHPNGLRAKEAARLMNDDDRVEIDSIARSAKNYLHRGFDAAGLGALFPRRDRRPWRLRNAISDVALAKRALERDDLDSAARLTDDGDGWLILFPRSGADASAPRRRTLLLGGQHAAQQTGVALPEELVVLADRVAHAVRERPAPPRDPPAAVPPPAVPPPAPDEPSTDLAVIEVEVVDAEPVEVPPPALAPPSARPAAPRLLPSGDAGPAPMIVPLRALSIVPTAPRQRPRRRLAALLAVVAAATATAVALLLWDRDGYADPIPVTVLNVIVLGPQEIDKDRSPVYLTTRRIPFCGNEGCNIDDTERNLGESYDGAVCQATGAYTTNGNDQTAADDDNPALVRSERYLGIRLADGTFGYVSVVWLARDAWGGLGLPTCPGT